MTGKVAEKLRELDNSYLLRPEHSKSISTDLAALAQKSFSALHSPQAADLEVTDYNQPTHRHALQGLLQRPDSAAQGEAEEELGEQTGQSSGELHSEFAGRHLD